MKTYNSASRSLRQANSDKSLVRKALKQIQRLEAKEQELLSLGQYALAYLHLVTETVKKLGRCFYSQETMAEMLGCHRATVQRKEAKLKEMGIVSVETIKRIGAKEVQVRTVNNPTTLKNLFKLLAINIVSIITLFSCNATRLFIDINLYEKNRQAAMALDNIRGGVPPDPTEFHQSSENKLTKPELDEIFGSNSASSVLAAPACLYSQEELERRQQILARQQAARERYQQLKKEYEDEQRRNSTLHP